MFLVPTTPQTILLNHALEPCVPERTADQNEKHTSVTVDSRAIGMPKAHLPITPNPLDLQFLCGVVPQK